MKKFEEMQKMFKLNVRFVFEPFLSGCIKRSRGVR